MFEQMQFENQNYPQLNLIYIALVTPSLTLTNASTYSGHLPLFLLQFASVVNIQL